MLYLKKRGFGTFKFLLLRFHDLLFYKKEINLNLYKIKTFEDIKFYMEYYNINMLKQILYALEYALKTLKKISIFKKKKL